MKRLLIASALFFASTSALAIDPFCAPWKNHPTPGTEYCTADHPNGIFVLELAANFCGPCNNNAPSIKALAASYANQPRVQVIDMMTDQVDSEISKWIARHRPTHPVLKDVGKKVWNQVGAQYIPTMVITDCNGNIEYQHTGSLNRAAAQQVIDRLLSQECTAGQ